LSSFAVLGCGYPSYYTPDAEVFTEVTPMAKVKGRPSKTLKAQTKVEAEEDLWEYCDHISGNTTLLRTRCGSDA